MKKKEWFETYLFLTVGNSKIIMEFPFFIIKIKITSVEISYFAEGSINYCFEQQELRKTKLKNLVLGTQHKHSTS